MNAQKGVISLQFQIVLSVMRQFLDDVKPFSLILFQCKITQQWNLIATIHGDLRVHSIL